MKRTPICVIILSFVFCTCKKEKDQEAELVDDITYTELNPFVEITSVDQLVYHPSQCGFVPYPTDSTAEHSLDINNDGEIDFILTCQSWYDFVSASQPCFNYNTKIQLTGTSDEKQVAYTGSYPVTDLLETGDVIDSDRSWRLYGSLLMSSANTPYSADFNGYQYLGLRIGEAENANYGWIYLNKDEHDITILSHAMNSTDGLSINAGQIE